MEKKILEAGVFSEVYLHIQVEECSEFNRLHFMINLALAIFPDAIDTMLADCHFTTAYQNDILIKSVPTEHISDIWNVFLKKITKIQTIFRT